MLPSLLAQLIDRIDARTDRSRCLCLKPSDFRPYPNRRRADLTPLHTAAWVGDLYAVRKYLRDGADPNAETIMGWGPLHLAVHQYAERAEHFMAVDEHESIVAELLRAGADAKARDVTGCLPAGMARGKQPRCLAEHMLAIASADPKAFPSYHDMPEHRRRRNNAAPACTMSDEPESWDLELAV